MLARPNPDGVIEPKTPMRVCVIYLRDNNDTAYSWTVDTRSCVRNIRPGVTGKFKFNTTKLGT